MQYHTYLTTKICITWKLSFFFFNIDRYTLQRTIHNTMACTPTHDPQFKADSFNEEDKESRHMIPQIMSTLLYKRNGLL